MSKTYQSLEDIVKEVIETVKPYEETYNREIPVIAAGGILEGADIGKMLNIGAGGVQMGSRFVATDECDANDEFKKSLYRCNER